MTDEQVLQNAKDANDHELVKFLEELKEGKSNKPAPNRAKNSQTIFLMELIQARKKAHLTQTALAEKVGIPQSSLARIEAGHSNPTLKTLLRLAEALNVQIVLQSRS